MYGCEESPMAAIAYPSQHPESRPRRHLTLAPPPAPRRRSRAGVYWRRRLLLLVAAAVLFVIARAALGALGGGPLAAPEAPAGRPSGAVYVVRPGDTFWTIARRLQPQGDVRA